MIAMSDVGRAALDEVGTVVFVTPFGLPVGLTSQIYSTLNMCCSSCREIDWQLRKRSSCCATWRRAEQVRAAAQGSHRPRRRGPARPAAQRAPGRDHSRPGAHPARTPDATTTAASPSGTSVVPPVRQATATGTLEVFEGMLPAFAYRPSVCLTERACRPGGAPGRGAPDRHSCCALSTWGGSRLPRARELAMTSWRETRRPTSRRTRGQEPCPFLVQHRGAGHERRTTNSPRTGFV